MKKAEIIYREILYQATERNNRILTQAGIAKSLGISLSTVNSAVKHLEKIGAVDVKKRGFHVVDARKTLYYWASIRSLQKDIIYATRAEKPVVEIEKSMPDSIVFAGFTAYKFLFKDVPADYSEIYVYEENNEESIKDIKKRFPENKGIPNLFVLKKDSAMDKYGKKTTMANTFVDLWNLKEWYAKEFVRAMEEKLHGILE